MSAGSTPSSSSGPRQLPILVRLSRVEAVVLVGVFLGVHAALATANLHLLSSAWPAVVALGLVAINAAAMLYFRADPLPRPGAMLIAATAPAVAALVSWQLPSEGWPGYAAWHIGATTLLLSAVAVRGRIMWAWLGFAGMVAMSLVWALSVHQGGAGFALSLIATHTMTITLASFLGITLSRLATGVVKESQRRALRAADEAAAQARIEERDGRLADVDRRARPLLERIASGAALDVAARRECVLLEAELRDSIRAARLSVEPVPSAARAARDRGVDVVLLDDRSKPMPPNLAHQVREAVAHELGRAHDGTVTVRLPPEGRATVATIVADTSEGYRSIEVDSG